jgi:hypothetical protein
MSRPAASAAVGFAVVLAAVLGTMALGAGLKAPCVEDTDWTDGRPYRLLCYSDIPPLLFTEQLQGGRLPILDRCTPVTTEPQQCDEYPVGTLYLQRFAAWIDDGTAASFFVANGLLLLACAVATVSCLYLLVGARALYVALAPTLLIYGLMNWDLFPVALATGATLAFFERRDRLAGILIGLGAAAKLYPALLLVPFAAERLRRRAPDGAIRLGWAAVGTWIAVNLPFAVLSPIAWSNFFRYNADRPTDWDSLWTIACRDAGLCPSVGVVNVASVLAFAVLAALVWRLKLAREPDFPRWSLAFPFVVLFLLASKVYSPQYGLWLLPLFALSLPSAPLFLAFSAADAAVFVTRFRFFAEHLGIPGGLPRWLFEAAVIARAGVLVACLVAWILLPAERAHAATPGAEPARAPA